jgi:hypothetical protein
MKEWLDRQRDKEDNRWTRFGHDSDMVQTRFGHSSDTLPSSNCFRHGGDPIEDLSGPILGPCCPFIEPYVPPKTSKHHLGAQTGPHATHVLACLTCNGQHICHKTRHTHTHVFSINLNLWDKTATSSSNGQDVPIYMILCEHLQHRCPKLVSSLSQQTRSPRGFSFFRSFTASSVRAWARWTYGDMTKLIGGTACDELDNHKRCTRSIFSLRIRLRALH